METITPSSQELALYRALAGGRTPKYPWETIPVNFSFVASCSLASAKQLAYRMAKKTGKKFRCYRHENGVIEVGRIA